MFKRYNLEIYLIDITTDIAIPSMMAAIIDRTGIGQSICISTRTDLDIIQAIRGAIFEAIQGRIEFRGVPFSSPDMVKKRKGIKIRSLSDKNLY